MQQEPVDNYQEVPLYSISRKYLNFHPLGYSTTFSLPTRPFHDTFRGTEIIFCRKKPHIICSTLQAGFNAGDGVNFYEIEGARTESVINLTRKSNVDIPGKFIFRTDAPEIEGFCSAAGK